MAEHLCSWFADRAYLLVFTITAIDATGTPFPGRMLLIAAGAVAAAGHARVSVMILLAAAGAVMGDHVWYLVGRFGGERLLGWYCRITLGSADCVEKAKAHFRRFGGWAILIARFSTTLRIAVTPLAAGSGIPYYQYVAFEIAGAVVWASLFVLLGYTLGEHTSTLVKHAGAASAALIVLVLVGGWFGVMVGYRLWKRARYGSAHLP